MRKSISFGNILCLSKNLGWKAIKKKSIDGQWAVVDTNNTQSSMGGCGIQSPTSGTCIYIGGFKSTWQSTWVIGTCVEMVAHNQKDSISFFEMGSTITLNYMGL